MKTYVRESSSLEDLIRKFLSDNVQEKILKEGSSNSKISFNSKLISYIKDELLYRASDPRKGKKILSDEEVFYLVHNLKINELRVGCLIYGKISNLDNQSVFLEYKNSGLKVLVQDLPNDKGRVGDHIFVKITNIVFKKNKVVATAKAEELHITEKLIFENFFFDKSQRQWTIFKKTFRPCK